MPSTSIRKETKLEQAQERLAQAIRRLELAVEAGAPTGGGRADDTAGEAGELDALRRQNEALRQVNATVAERLDSTIDRLRLVIKE